MSLVILDLVRKSLNEVEGMMSTLKEKLGDTAIEIDLAHGRTNISKRQVRQSIDRFTVAEREKLDSTTYTDFESLCSLLEKSLAAIVCSRNELSLMRPIQLSLNKLLPT